LSLDRGTKFHPTPSGVRLERAAIERLIADSGRIEGKATRQHQTGSVPAARLERCGSGEIAGKVETGSSASEVEIPETHLSDSHLSTIGKRGCLCGERESCAVDVCVSRDAYASTSQPNVRAPLVQVMRPNRR